MVASVQHQFLTAFVPGSLAHNGHDVRVYDCDSSVLNRVESRLAEDRRTLREDGFLVGHSSMVRDVILRPNSFPLFQGDVYCFSLLEEALKGCQFVIESITENLEKKKDIFKGETGT